MVISLVLLLQTACVSGGSPSPRHPQAGTRLSRKLPGEGSLASLPDILLPLPAVFGRGAGVRASSPDLRAPSLSCRLWGPASVEGGVDGVTRGDRQARGKAAGPRRRADPTAR